MCECSCVCVSGRQWTIGARACQHRTVDRPCPYASNPLALPNGNKNAPKKKDETKLKVMAKCT